MGALTAEEYKKVLNMFWGGNFYDQNQTQSQYRSLVDRDFGEWETRVVDVLGRAAGMTTAEVPTDDYQTEQREEYSRGSKASTQTLRTLVTPGITRIIDYVRALNETPYYAPLLRQTIDGCLRSPEGLDNRIREFITILKIPENEQQAVYDCALAYVGTEKSGKNNNPRFAEVIRAASPQGKLDDEGMFITQKIAGCIGAYHQFNAPLSKNAKLQMSLLADSSAFYDEYGTIQAKISQQAGKHTAQDIANLKALAARLEQAIQSAIPAPVQATKGLKGVVAHAFTTLMSKSGSSSNTPQQASPHQALYEHLRDIITASDTGTLSSRMNQTAGLVPKARAENQPQK